MNKKNYRKVADRRLSMKFEQKKAKQNKEIHDRKGESKRRKLSLPYLRRTVKSDVFNKVPIKKSKII